MITQEAIAVWTGFGLKEIRKRTGKQKMTERQALIVAIATFLDISYKSAEDFYYRYRRTKNER